MISIVSEVQAPSWWFRSPRHWSQAGSHGWRDLKLNRIHLSFTGSVMSEPVIVYKALRQISEWTLSTFYSEVTVRGQENIPQNGPLIMYVQTVFNMPPPHSC